MTDDQTDLETLADLADLIGRRQAELRLMITEAAALIDLKLNEIDRFAIAAGRVLARLQAAAQTSAEHP